MPHYNHVMAKLAILRYPDPRLHRKAKPVAQVDERIRQLVADMAQTMYEAPGIGLAATQVDVHEQVLVTAVVHIVLLFFCVLGAADAYLVGLGDLGSL